MRDVERRNCAVRGQRPHPTSREIGSIREELQYHQCAVFCSRLPSPGELLTLVVLRAFETHSFQIFFQRVIRLGIGQDLQIDDNVHVTRSGMRRHQGRLGVNEIPGREAAHQKYGVFPGTQSRSSVTSTRSQSIAYASL